VASTSGCTNHFADKGATLDVADTSSSFGSGSDAKILLIANFCSWKGIHVLLIGALLYAQI
jgi:hypothetical protein